MKYFVISDIHGYYEAMISSLDKANYDSTNKNHHLIVIGDLFDRGPNSKKVFEYLYPLEIDNKATVLLGNHETFLIDFFEERFTHLRFNINHNGFGKTIKSFYPGSVPRYISPADLADTIYEKHPNLYDWIKQRPYLYEVEDYIFVHGGIDPRKDNYDELTRHDYIWSREHKLPKIPGKTVVCGHTRVPTIRYPKEEDFYKLYEEDPSAFDILYLDGKICIDRFVEITNELNVFTFKTEE